MIPVLTATVTVCCICGEVSCERDLLYVETGAEAESLGVEIGDTVCTECADR